MSNNETAGESGTSSLGWWLALLLLVVGVWFYVDRIRLESLLRDAEQATPTDQARSALTNELQVEVTEKGARISEFEREMAELETELWQERDALAEAQRESNRLQVGLESAVDEINRLRSELDQLQTAAALAPRPRQRVDPRPTSPVQPLGPPHVTVNPAGFVIASGLVKNSGDWTARGSLEVSLLGPEGPIDTRRASLYLAPGSTERYDITFAGIIPAGPIAASVRWVE